MTWKALLKPWKALGSGLQEDKHKHENAKSLEKTTINGTIESILNFMYTCTKRQFRVISNLFPSLP